MGDTANYIFWPKADVVNSHPLILIGVIIKEKFKQTTTYSSTRYFAQQGVMGNFAKKPCYSRCEKLRYNCADLYRGLLELLEGCRACSLLFISGEQSHVNVSSGGQRNSCRVTNTCIFLIFYSLCLATILVHSSPQHFIRLSCECAKRQHISSI